MARLISNATTISKSISWKGISENTERLSFVDVESIEWSDIRELHILGSQQTDYDKVPFWNDDISVKQYGVYISFDRTWVLLLGPPENLIDKIVARCTTKLKNLDIRFTSISQIDLAHLIGVKRLNLAENTKLISVIGLYNLKDLYVLDLKRSSLNFDINVSGFNSLYSLSIRDTGIGNVIANVQLFSMTYFDAANTKLQDCKVVSQFPSLKVLNLNGTGIREIPEVGRFKSLEILNISNTHVCKLPSLVSLNTLRTLNIGYTDIDDLEEVSFPRELRSLVLTGTNIKRIPESIKNLANLRKLALSDMVLESLPSWLPALRLEFSIENKNGFGINLYNTVVQDVDMSIFSQPRPVIEAWFRSRESANQAPATLDESKVVFLGDGGAGKSLTVQRLLAEGENPESFDGNATPGISITSKTYNIAGKDVLVHFWDFGGQEILHSMHRMFLTRRTLYIVLVNARDNTQDERARYWLHNIKSFANGSPVLLVLNQIDQNPSASVNEVSLRELYPQLTKVIKLSAKNNSVEEFNNAFESEMVSEISKMPSLGEPFLPAWSLLKTRLQNMSENYIDSNAYARISEECGVEDNYEVRNALLDWFSDLGVSFCYRDSAALSNYMILRPDWITNAIYVILFNCSGNVENGIIKHETIHWLLHPTGNPQFRPKSVLSGVNYSVEETEYVLGVIRKFRLSYRIDDDTEFIPMLCERNEKSIAIQFTENESVLEYHMHYSYLPNNVIHRLMVEMRSHLDIQNVWLTGAVFAQEGIGLSALVKSQDNILKIYVKSESSLHPANTYLNIIKNTIDRINKALGLSAHGSIIYKADGRSESFDYEYITESYQHGNVDVYSRVFKKNLKILDILNKTDRGVTEKQTRLIGDIVSACQMMQSTKIYWKASEDDRNTFVRDILRTKGYYIADQTRSGKSSTGKQPGELDIEIRESSDTPWTVYEALNITGFAQTSKNNWNEHLIRLLDNYNPLGYPFLFLVSYLECTKDRFKEIWLDYFAHLSVYSPLNYSLQSVEGQSDESFYIRSAQCVYDRAGLPTTVYHICVRLGE